MGLDRHPVERYYNWVSRAVQGDLGLSPRSGASINEMIGRRLPNSALLAFIAFGVAVPTSLAIAMQEAMFGAVALLHKNNTHIQIFFL